MREVFMERFPFMAYVPSDVDRLGIYVRIPYFTEGKLVGC
jgi:hypothetical protein